MMELFDAERLSVLLPWAELIDAIAEIVAAPDAVSPERHVHTIAGAGADEDLLLIKPAWIPGSLLGIKAVTFFGSNSAKGQATINASYLLFDGATGAPVAVMDGEELGSRRTAAASALAVRSLAREDVDRLLVVGTGQLAPHLVAAHASVRTYTDIAVWGRDRGKAQRVVDVAVAAGLPARCSEDLDADVGQADVISCATSATEPLVKGALLQPGTHLDLIGSFKPDMRESDDECARRASVFVDTYEGAVLAGDLSQPLESGVLGRDDLRADLRALATGTDPGRRSAEEITLFKSAGFALEDLAAARLAYGRARG